MAIPHDHRAIMGLALVAAERRRCAAVCCPAAAVVLAPLTASPAASPPFPLSAPDKGQEGGGSSGGDSSAPPCDLAAAFLAEALEAALGLPLEGQTVRVTSAVGKSGSSTTTTTSTTTTGGSTLDSLSTAATRALVRVAARGPQKRHGVEAGAPEPTAMDEDVSGGTGGNGAEEGSEGSVGLDLGDAVAVCGAAFPDRRARQAKARLKLRRPAARPAAGAWAAAEAQGWLIDEGGGGDDDDDDDVADGGHTAAAAAGVGAGAALEGVQFGFGYGLGEDRSRGLGGGAATWLDSTPFAGDEIVAVNGVSLRQWILEAAAAATPDAATATPASQDDFVDGGGGGGFAWGAGGGGDGGGSDSSKGSGGALLPWRPGGAVVLTVCRQSPFAGELGKPLAGEDDCAAGSESESEEEGGGDNEEEGGGRAAHGGGDVSRGVMDLGKDGAVTAPGKAAVSASAEAAALPPPPPRPSRAARSVSNSSADSSSSAEAAATGTPTPQVLTPVGPGGGGAATPATEERSPADPFEAVPLASGGHGGAMHLGDAESSGGAFAQHTDNGGGGGGDHDDDEGLSDFEDDSEDGGGGGGGGVGSGDENERLAEVTPAAKAMRELTQAPSSTRGAGGGGGGGSAGPADAKAGLVAVGGEVGRVADVDALRRLGNSEAGHWVGRLFARRLAQVKRGAAKEVCRVHALCPSWHNFWLICLIFFSPWLVNNICMWRLITLARTRASCDRKHPPSAPPAPQVAAVWVNDSAASPWEALGQRRRHFDRLRMRYVAQLVATRAADAAAPPPPALGPALGAPGALGPLVARTGGDAAAAEGLAWRARRGQAKDVLARTLGAALAVKVARSRRGDMHALMFVLTGCKD